MFNSRSETHRAGHRTGWRKRTTHRAGHYSLTTHRDSRLLRTWPPSDPARGQRRPSSSSGYCAAPSLRSRRPRLVALRGDTLPGPRPCPRRLRRWPSSDQQKERLSPIRRTLTPKLRSLFPCRFKAPIRSRRFRREMNRSNSVKHWKRTTRVRCGGRRYRRLSILREPSSGLKSIYGTGYQPAIISLPSPRCFSRLAPVATRRSAAGARHFHPETSLLISALTTSNPSSGMASDGRPRSPMLILKATSYGPPSISGIA